MSYGHVNQGIQATKYVDSPTGLPRRQETPLPNEPSTISKSLSSPAGTLGRIAANAPGYAASGVVLIGAIPLRLGVFFLSFLPWGLGKISPTAGLHVANALSFIGKAAGLVGASLLFASGAKSKASGQRFDFYHLSRDVSSWINGGLNKLIGQLEIDKGGKQPTRLYARSLTGNYDLSGVDWKGELWGKSEYEPELPAGRQIMSMD